MGRELSQKVYAASCIKIPGGVNSPMRAFPGLEMTPIIAARGKGDTVWDVDGHVYIDFCQSWGALILGHADPDVASAAVRQIYEGSSFGMATPCEEELASAVIRHFPSIEKIRFVSSGTEAVMSAARLAKGFTKKPLIVKFSGNYHGHSDTLLKEPHVLPYNDPVAAKEFLTGRSDIAAVVVEPIAGNMGVVIPSRAFLQTLREETAKIGALLIFDEVITGFRVGLHGAQGYFGIFPDLTCLGKIIGGGFPAAAFGGRQEIMDFLAPLGPVYQAGTLSGNPVAMQAGLAVLEKISQAGFYEELERKTKIVTDGLPNVTQIGSMFTIFSSRYKELFFHLFENGVYFPPFQGEACFVSMAHTDENLMKTRRLIERFLDAI